MLETIIYKKSRTTIFFGKCPSKIIACYDNWKNKPNVSYLNVWAKANL